MPPALSPLKATTQLSILDYCSPRSSPAQSSAVNSPPDRPQSSTKRSLLLDSSTSNSRRSSWSGVARKQDNEDEDEDDESMEEENGSEEKNLTPATPPPARRIQRSPSRSSTRQTTRKDTVEEEDSDEDDHDEDDQIMVDAEDAGTEAEQAIGLNDSGMYPLGTVITKEFDEGWFTGKIVSYVLIDDDSYPQYHVHYEDGDEEDLSLSEIEVLFEAAAKKRNATKEPAKKKRKMTAKAHRKMTAKAHRKITAKANSGKKPAAIQKRKLTPPRQARGAKESVADLDDSSTDVECDSNSKKKPAAVQKRRLTPSRNVRDTKKIVASLDDSDSDSNSKKKAAAVQKRRLTPSRNVRDTKKIVTSLEDSDSDSNSKKKAAAVQKRRLTPSRNVRDTKKIVASLENSDSDSNKMSAAVPNRRSSPRKAQNTKRYADESDAETESDVDSDGGAGLAAAKPKTARAPSKKKGAAKSASDKRTAAKRKAAPTLSTKKDAATSTSDKRNVLKVPYSGGDGLEIISEPQAMFDDMIDTKLTDNGENSEVLIPLVKALKNRTLRVATMCSGTESPILALDMLQKSIRKHCSTHLSREMDDLGIDVENLFQIEHVFSCEIEPFKQAYIERNFRPPLLFRDIRELGDDKAHTAYGGLVDVPNAPGCVDMLIAGTSCVDYSNLNNRKVSELGGIKQLCLLRGILTRPLLLPNAHRKRLTRRAKVDRHSGGWLIGLKRHSRRLLSSRTSLERRGHERLRSLRNEATQRPSFVSIRRTTTFPIPDSVATYLQ
jgi:hypothetical protein